VDTLQTPDLVKATASLERLRLLREVGCVELAHDVAETIQPRNSLERLLAGQLASAHLASLKLLTLGLDYAARTTQWQQADAVEACRLVNASARLMSVFQEGLLTLAKLRTGGKQVVVVQHVYVNDGGQAVVAGDLTTGGSSAVGAGVTMEEQCHVPNHPHRLESPALWGAHAARGGVSSASMPRQTALSKARRYQPRRPTRQSARAEAWPVYGARHCGTPRGPAALAGAAGAAGGA
jgi:hypothetical protein